MKHSETYRRRPVPINAFTLCTAALSCSGYYPLGEANQEHLLDGDPVGSVPSDTQVDAMLAPADFEIDARDEWVGPGSLAAVGDLDGDGYGDTAQTRSDISLGTSMLVIRYGGPRPQNAIELLAFQDEAATLALEFGDPSSMTVFAAGDVDADGFDDMLVQMMRCRPTQPGAGTYLVYGGPARLAGTIPLASVAARFPAPERTLVNNGYTCGTESFSLGVGDLDADGIDDFIISIAPQNTLSATHVPGTGEGLYVFNGRRQRFSGEVALAQADARLVAPAIEPPVNAFRVGDVNGDEHADVLITPNFGAKDSLLLFGGDRVSGELQLSDVAMPLPGVGPQSRDLMRSPGDLDGDGIDDLLLRDESKVARLFYGAPGLFADGFDFARADATIEGGGAGAQLFFAGDRDGDGDDELLDRFIIDPEPVTLPTDVALTSGSHERLSGIFTLPEAAVMAHNPHGPFDDPQLVLLHVIPAGDLDGDGAQDLFTVIEGRRIIDHNGFEPYGQRIGVHYGTPGGIVRVPR
jgi:hypothetical protein